MRWPGALNAPARGGSAQRSASGFCCLPKLESMTELFRGTRARPNQSSRYDSGARGHEWFLLVSYSASCLCGLHLVLAAFSPYISLKTPAECTCTTPQWARW